MNSEEIRQKADGCFDDSHEVSFDDQKFWLLNWNHANGLNLIISKVYDLALKKKLTSRPGRLRRAEHQPWPNELHDDERQAAQMFFNLAAYCGQHGIDLARAVIIQHVHNITEINNDQLNLSTSGRKRLTDRRYRLRKDPLDKDPA